MTKESVKKRLAEFRKARRTPPYDGVEEVMKETGFIRLTKRKKSIWGKRDYGTDVHWQKLNLDEYETDKPIIVCLSGNGTKTEQLANGFCKRVEKMLELLLKDKSVSEDIKAEDYVDILGCCYGRDTKYLFCPDDEGFRELYPDVNKYAEDFPEAMEMGNMSNTFSNAEAKQFAENVLLSKCLNKEGKRLPIDECQRGVSQVIFFTYCYGAQALNSIMDNFEVALLKVGFARADIQKIIDSMSHVSFARKEYSRKIPTTFFYAVNDFDIGSINYLRKSMLENNSQLKTKLCKAGEKTFGQTYAEERFGDETTSECLEFAYMGIEEKEDFSSHDAEHYIANMDRDDNWDIINKRKGIYNPISQMMSWALCRAVENGLNNAKATEYIPKISMEEMENELMSIYTSFSSEDLMTNK